MVQRAWLASGVEPCRHDLRKLDDERKADLDQPKAIELMLAQPSMIKRPVLDLGDRTLIGFKPDIYAAEIK